MEIEFSNDATGYRKANQLMILLEFIRTHDLSNRFDDGFIEGLEHELNHFLSQPAFNSLRKSEAPKNNLDDVDTVTTSGILNMFRRFIGPGSHEQKLSAQRRELVERAERAENMAFNTLAELTEVARQRDEVLKKLKDKE